MNCERVLGLLDAGPFADCARADLDAAYEHARQCANCGLAVESAAILTKALAALPQPDPPPNLGKAVLARITQIEDARRVAAGRSPEGSSRPTWWAWATGVGGLVTGLTIVLSVRPGSAASGQALGVAGGLMLYAAGLFAPLLPARSRQ